MKLHAIVLALSLALFPALAGLAGPAYAAQPSADRKQHEDTAEKKLADLGRKMDRLAAEARKAGSRTRDELNRLYDEFKKKEAGAGEDLEKMREATNEEWEKSKVRLNKAIEDLNGIYERAKAQRAGEKKGTSQ